MSANLRLPRSAYPDTTPVCLAFTLIPEYAFYRIWRDPFYHMLIQTAWDCMGYDVGKIQIRIYGQTAQHFLPLFQSHCSGKRAFIKCIGKRVACIIDPVLCLSLPISLHIHAFHLFFMIFQPWRPCFFLRSFRHPHHRSRTAPIASYDPNRYTPCLC